MISIPDLRIHNSCDERDDTSTASCLTRGLLRGNAKSFVIDKAMRRCTRILSQCPVNVQLQTRVQLLIKFYVAMHSIE